jgi:hypothetical protein
MKTTKLVRQGSNRNIRNMVDVNKTSHTRSTRSTSQSEVCKRDRERFIAEMVAATILYSDPDSDSDSVRLFYAKSFNRTDERTEIITTDKFALVQIKMAAHRLLIETSLADTDEMDYPGPVAMYVGKSDKDTNSGFELTFSFDESVPTPTNNDDLFRLIGVPEVPKIIEFSNDEVGQIYRKVENKIGFTNEGLTNDEYDEIFLRSDYPKFFSEICEAMFIDYGHIDIPTMTTSEFGNVLNSFNEFNAEVAFATLCEINNVHSSA